MAIYGWVQPVEDARGGVHGALDACGARHHEPACTLPRGRQQASRGDARARLGRGVDVPSAQLVAELDGLLQTERRQTATAPASNEAAATDTKDLYGAESIAVAMRVEADLAELRKLMPLVGVRG